MDDGNDQVEALTLEPPSAGRRSRRAGALWAALAAVAVVAGAVVVDAADDDDGPPPGLPVALAAARAGGGDAESAADATLAPVTYVAGDDLPELGGEATAYRLRAGVSEEQVRSLADALGLAGPAVHHGPSWTVDDDGEHLEVYDDGVGQWWYSATGGSASGGGSSSGSAGVELCVDGPEDVGTECEVPPTPTTTPECTATDGPAECLIGECTDDCAPSTPCDDPASECVMPTTTSTECGPGADCVAPSPPPTGGPDCAVASNEPDRCVDPSVPSPDLPAQEEARAIALDLLAATGVDVDDAVVTVDGGFDAWYVSVEPRLDGVPSGLLANVSVGSGGVVTMAGGTLAEPEPLGGYPLLDTRAAIDRANAGDGSEAPAVARDVGSAASAASSCAPGAECVDEVVDAVTTVPPCAVQPDGREICEQDAGKPSPCPQVVAPADEALEAPESIECDVPVPDPGGLPGTVEVLLVDAEPALVLLGAVDGSGDGYLVPAYRFTDADGGTVDLPAVADSALTTSPPTTDPSDVPAPPVTDTVVEPQPCDAPLVEEDASGTTITVQPNPDCVAPEPGPLADGEEPAVGVGYYVDVDTTCEAFELGGRVWVLDDGDVSDWADPGERHEGGTFTLDAVDHGTFVGDQKGVLTATFRLPATDEDAGACTPVPRP